MLSHLEPDALLARLEASGLRGRGGGWFPAARKWRAVRREGGVPLIVANGAEGEPGSVKDRFVMRTRAVDVVAGLQIAARCLGAEEAIVYLGGAFEAEARALHRALAGRPAGSLPVRVHRGESSYVAGEETALLESLEGRRPWPRPKPPLPAAIGLWGRPTLVQNVETLARVPAAVSDPEAFREAEVTLVSVWGHVGQPGVREIRLGTPVTTVIEAAGGAPRGVALAFPAGPSAAPLTAAALDTPLSPEALREQGSSLGTAALLVIGTDCCPVLVAGSLAAFFARESCEQCPPCTQGTGSLARLVEGLEAGTTRTRDLAYLRDAAGFMSQHGYCAHPRAGAAAVVGLLDRLAADVEAHLAQRGCPRPGSACRPFDSDAPERAAIEAALEAQTRESVA